MWLVMLMLLSGCGGVAVKRSNDLAAPSQDLRDCVADFMECNIIEECTQDEKAPECVMVALKDWTFNRIEP